MDADDVHAEYARLVERFRMREEMYDRAVARHKLEMEMVWEDLVAAGCAKDAFEQAHPEVTD